MRIQKLKDISFIVGSMSSRIPLMVFLYLLSIGLELIGLSLIMPYVTAIQTPEQLENFPIWTRVTGYFSFATHTDAVLFLSFIILIIFGVKIALNAFIQNVIILFSYDLQVSLRKRLAKAYIRAPYLFHTTKRSSEIINIMQGHVSLFSKGVVGSLLRLCGEVATISVIGLYLLISYPIPLLIAISVISSFIVIYLLTLQRRLRRYGREVAKSSKDLIVTITQGIKAIKEARVFGNSKYFEDNIIETAERVSTVNSKVAFLQILPRFFLEFLIVLIIVLTVIFNLLIYGEEAQVLNNLVVFAVASLRLLPSASQVSSNLNTLIFASPMMEEILSDIKATGDGKLKPSKQNIKSIETLTLSNLIFNYPDTGTPILNGVNFSIRKGEIVGLFGESGSGKTTLVNILLGLLSFQHGKILFNGEEIGKDEWRKSKFASYIPQTPTMLDDQVMSNVAIGQKLDEIDRNKVHEALMQARLAPLIETLPQGIETIAGEDALFLSGGQKQRLAISRSFYFNRNLIILDEVTSALDMDTETEVLSAIKELRKGAAVLIISHSPQVANICDRIYYLENGKLTEK